MNHVTTERFAQGGTQKRPSVLIRFYCVLRRERNCNWAISRVPSFATRINRHRVGTNGKAKVRTHVCKKMETRLMETRTISN